MTPSPASDPFVGRARELAVLTEALETAIGGHGGIVTVSGEAGIGKTRLAEKLSQQAEARDAETLWGRCHEEGGAPSYWPWVRAVRSHVLATTEDRLHKELGTSAALLGTVLPEITTRFKGAKYQPVAEESAEQTRFRLFDAFTTFLGNAASNRPIVLFLDDLQWADGSSLDLLEFVAPEIRTVPILIVCAYRDTGVQPGHGLPRTLASLRRESAYRGISLEGLGRTETSDLIEAGTGNEPAAELVGTVHDHTDGNPFFIGEVMHVLQQQGLESAMPGEPNWQLGVPVGVTHLLGRRLESVPAGSQAAMETAALIGREFDVRILVGAMAETPREEVLGMLDDGITTGIIQEDGSAAGRYRFVHSLIQQALVERLPLSRRVRAHGAIAKTLESASQGRLPERAAELARHFEAAETITGPEPIYRYSIMAGQQALASNAHQEALDHFQRARNASEELASGAGADDTDDLQARAALYDGLGRCQAAVGLLVEAQHSVQVAFRLYVDVGDMNAAIAIAKYPLNVYYLGGELLPFLEQALEHVPPESLDAGWLLSRHGSALADGGKDYDRAQESLKASLAIAQRENDVDLISWTYGRMGFTDFLYNHLESSLKNARRALEALGSSDHPFARTHSHIVAAWSAIHLGHLGIATEHADQCLIAAGRTRDPLRIAQAHNLRMGIALLAGDPDSARQIHDLQTRNNPADLVIRVLGIALEWLFGPVDDTAPEFGEVFPSTFTSRQISNTPGEISPMIQAHAAFLTRDSSLAATAEQWLNEWINRPHPGAAVAGSMTRAKCAIVMKNVEIEPTAYEELLPYAGMVSGPPVPAFFMPTDRLLADLASDLGRTDDAAAHYEATLALCRKGGFRTELVLTCYQYAEMLSEAAADADRHKASALLREGLQVAETIGMGRLQKQLADLDEKLAAGRQVRDRYPDGLTAREVEVLRELAAGKSNREIAEALFISQNTVIRHIANIFSKTGSANRALAAVYAAEHKLQ